MSPSVKVSHGTQATLRAHSEPLTRGGHVALCFPCCEESSLSDFSPGYLAVKALLVVLLDAANIGGGCHTKVCLPRAPDPHGSDCRGATCSARLLR